MSLTLKTYAPLQINVNQRTLEQDRVFHWIVSTSLFVRLSTGKTELMHDCIADMMESMGEIPMLDMGMPKPRAEWLINGSFHALDGEPTIAGQAFAQVSDQQKTLNIFGDRHWVAGIPSKPLPFTNMPLDYQHAFGGSDLPSNPSGMGYLHEHLPNVESSTETITDRNKPYTPASFAALDPSWPQRSQYQGTYDQRYMEKYFPGYPKDMDWRLFMNAPKDQWVDGFLTGNESYQFKNMHPHKKHIEGQLPGLFPRCFIKDSQEANSEQQFKEINLNLDTATFFPDKDIVQLIWRGGMVVSSDEAEQISHMILGFEHSKDERRKVAHYKEAMERRIKAKDPLLDSLNTQDLIPLGAASAMQLLQQSALDNNVESQLNNNMQAKVNLIQDSVNKTVDSSLTKLKKQLDNPTIDQAKRDQIVEKLDTLGAPSNQDPDTQALMAKLEAILPGINAADPKKLDLCNFSFNEMDDIFAQINAFTDNKKSQALEAIKPEVDKLKIQLVQGDGLEKLSDEQRQQITQQIESLENLGKEAPSSPSPLPRINFEDIKQQLAGTTPEILKAQKELHLMLSNPLMANSEALVQAKTKLDNLQKGMLDSIDQELDNAQQQFIMGYGMGAHFSENGLSPHEDNASQMQKLLVIINGDKNARGKDWACLDLSNKNLDGMDFSDCLMEQVNLSGASLIGANFSGAILARANFNKANCSRANFNNANIGASTCINTNFDHASFLETKLSKSKFENTCFSYAKFVNPEVLEIELDTCSFEHSLIENWQFLELKLNDINFKSAKLTTCNFINCSLKDCCFDNANLTSTAWSDTSLSSVSFVKANLTSNCFVSAVEVDDKQDAFTTGNLDFSKAILHKANLQGLNLKNCLFTFADISSANFNGADLSHSNFDDCQGHQTTFRKAILTGASMKRADLMGAVLGKAIITDTNLENANLYGVDFIRATVKGTRFNHANLDATILKDWRPA